MQPMQILVLGSEGLGRTALEETLTRLGYVVMAADARPGGNAPSSGDIVMLDLRGDDADAEASGLAERLRLDERPVMVVSERPRRGVMRALSGRPAGAMVMTGSESEAGYRVALNICAGLRRSHLDRAAFSGLSVAV
jgi:chemotaxis response regulator CheB